MMPEARPCVLVFAGLDPSGGAGLSADLQAIAGQGAHALTVCTALTVQDNDRVYGVRPVEAELVLRQARALADKFVISAIKIGITGSAANAQAIADFIVWLRSRAPTLGSQPATSAATASTAAAATTTVSAAAGGVTATAAAAGADAIPGAGVADGAWGRAELPVVLDPVLASGHGDLLSRDDAAQALAPLLPLTTILTPNGPEAQTLSDATQPEAQADALRARGCRHVLITGGHGDGDHVINRWYGPGAPREWRWPRIDGAFHGSGCTLAAAIAGQLAAGLPTAIALEQAQHYVYHALRDAYAIAAGQRIPLR
jgi:hydroxymethylpyrimidine/phosphomethylpyrimidine kinase